MIAYNDTTSFNANHYVTVDLYLDINSESYKFAHGGNGTNINTGELFFLNFEYYNVRIKDSGTATIRCVITHRATAGTVSSSTSTSVYINIYKNSIFSAKRNPGVYIGDNIAAIGPISDDNHIILGSEIGRDKETAFDVAINGNNVIMSDDIYIKHKDLGLRPSLNPVTIDISGRSSATDKKISEREMYIIYKAFKAGIPVYIKTNATVPNNGEFVYLLARVNAVSEQIITTNNIDVTIFATADLHSMSQGVWSDTTDYRVNLFANRSLNKALTYDTASTSLTGNFLLKMYIHTI